ncbi:MAG: hypothetical protein AVDCRST_MAG16-18 [uncultured Frankineae bacterium]|uniref:DUF2975 domain-containing protein n=1 Tax=uncultured Frankineae bacterium TaxID=437475 RepID=A0A6J4KN85_9ACTN|nr:MAG: hypothetical protein AVDCRST_MAG16-18 [uncultured Frankineae bacterium]
MQLRQWSRTDQVFLEGVLWALPGVALLTVVVDGVRALRGAPLEATGSLPDDLARTTGLVTGPMTGTVVVQDPTPAQYGWDLAPAILLLVLAAVVARLLLGVARSLRTGDPFTPANALRLRTLGVILIVGGTFVPVFQGIAFEGVLDPVLPDGPRAWTLDVQLWPALSGVLVGFLAEVFARGARMREDVEGLV